MKLNKRNKKALSLNITSLIDVLFILLLFFVVTSTFKDLSGGGLDIELPSSSDTASKDVPKEEVLYLDKDDQVSLLGKVFPLDSLDAFFQANKDSIQAKVLIFKGDQKASYQSFITVFDILKTHQINKLVIATEVTDE